MAVLDTLATLRYAWEQLLQCPFCRKAGGQDNSSIIFVGLTGGMHAIGMCS